MIKLIGNSLLKRRMAKVFCHTALFCFIGFAGVFAQPARKFSALYYDKVSMFRVLPSDSGCVVFLGDSITERCEWNELLGNLKIIQRGISGDITEGVLERLDEITSRKPKKLFLMIGVNDLRRNISSDSIMANYSKIIERIKGNSPETRIIIQSVLPVNSAFKDAKTTCAKITELNQKIKSFASKEGLPFLNLFPEFVNRKGELNEELTSDGLHINGKGYLIWKKMIYENKLL
jgi:lysophospholipase L1-like esterase